MIAEPLIARASLRRTTSAAISRQSGPNQRGTRYCVQNCPSVGMLRSIPLTDQEIKHDQRFTTAADRRHEKGHEIRRKGTPERYSNAAERREEYRLGSEETDRRTGGGRVCEEAAQEFGGV